MKTGRGKAVAIWTGLLGIAALIGAAYVFRNRLFESYYLHKLESADHQERVVAAKRLASLSSVQAVPRLLQIFVQEVGQRGVQWEFSTVATIPELQGCALRLLQPRNGNAKEIEEVLPFFRSAQTAARNTPESALPLLVDLLGSEDRLLRSCAALILGRLGRVAEGAAPPQLAALAAQESDPNTRSVVTWALSRIQGKEGHGE